MSHIKVVIDSYDSLVIHVFIYTITVHFSGVLLSCQLNCMSSHCISLSVDKWQIGLILFSYPEAITKWACWPSQYIITIYWRLFINIEMDIYLVGNVKGEWSKSGMRVHRYLCMFKWTTMVNKNMLWFPSTENAGNLCSGSFFFFFCQLYLLDFHTPTPAVPQPPLTPASRK